MNNHCLYCDAFIQSEMSWKTLFLSPTAPTFCESCLEKMQLIHGETCVSCSRPLKQLAPEFVNQQTCLDCVRWEQDPTWKNTLLKNTSLYIYNDFLKEIIARFKFRGDYELAKCFAQDIHKSLNKLEFDFIIPIPLSKERLKERGFNQSEALAQTAGFETHPILERIHAEKQSKKSREERLAQTNVFKLRAKSSPIQGKKLLLIDDVYTTGSTLRHAAKILKDNGASKIQSFSVARG